MADKNKISGSGNPFLTVDSIKKHFPVKGSFLATGKLLKAVDGISFEVCMTMFLPLSVRADAGNQQ